MMLQIRLALPGDPGLGKLLVNRRSFDLKRWLNVMVLPILVTTGVALFAGLAVGDGTERSGEQIYKAACATCHGSDGRGRGQHRVGFETALPDFSDCSFSTREPNGDWGSVTAEGGPARVFDKMMPAFGDALSEAEIERTLEHLRGFCHDKASWPRGELNMPRPLITEKAFVEDEVVLSTSVATKSPSAVTNKLIYETRLLSRGQVEVIVPFGFREADNDTWSAGLGDLALATKWALLFSHNTGSILSLATEVILPTGDEAKGYGKGTTIIEPFLAFGQLLPLNGFMQLQAGAELSTDPDRAHELFWRGAFGATLAGAKGGRAWSPMIEVLGAHELEDGQPVHWDLVPQVQVALSKRQHVLASLGVRVPLNDTSDRKPQILFYLLWDWFDGGFFEGW